MAKKGKIITAGIEQEYKKATRPVMENPAKRVLGRVLTGQIAQGSSTSVVEPFFTPWTQRTTIEVPTQYKELVKWRRYFYNNEPLVSSACELHAQFPLSTFYIAHEDPKIGADFERMTEDIGFFEFLLELLLEYWVVGEAIPFGFLDNVEDPHFWTDFVLLDPTAVEIQWDPIARGKKKEIMKLEPSKTIQNIVNDGPMDKDTGELYGGLPSDIIETVKKGEKLNLNSMQASHIKRPGSYHNVRGTSIIDRSFKWLMYRDKLRSAQYVVADRHITPREFYFIGSDAEPASQEELDAFKDLLMAQWSSPNSAIVYHHAVKVEWMGAAGHILPLQPEFQYIDKQLAIALLINEGVVTAAQQPYASTSVALDVMIQRYLILRMRVQNWVENKVFKPVCQMNKIIKRTKVELEYGIRFNSKEPEYNIPKIKWDKEDMRNDMTKLQMLIGLADKAWIPRSMILEKLDIDPDEAKKELEKEKQENQGLNVPPLPGQQTGDMSGMFGESPPMNEPIPEGESEGLPESPPGGEAFPPESAEAMGGEGGLPSAV